MYSDPRVFLHASMKFDNEVYMHTEEKEGFFRPHNVIDIVQTMSRLEENLSFSLFTP